MSLCGEVNKRVSEDFFTMQDTEFGPLAIVWTGFEQQPSVCRVYLSNERFRAGELVKRGYRDARMSSCDRINKLGEQIEAFLAGADVRFELDLVKFDLCTPFQREVLIAEHKIPRGWFTTYQRLAAALEKPTAARAIGTALAHNPFPIIIPCHRAIRSDRTPGGFQGGLRMKRALLEREGIQFSQEGKVITNRVYY